MSDGTPPSDGLSADEWMKLTADLHLERIDALMITEGVECGQTMDLIQEVWIKALKHMYPLGRHPETIGPWLYRVAVNEARDFITARIRFTEIISNLALSGLIRTDYRVSDCVRADDVVNSALDKIDPDLASLLRAHFMEGLSFVEIARKHGVEYHQIQYRKGKALAELRSIFPTDVKICD
jgi:RNA polymerase sigma factor (sigma-70 family)